MRVALPADSAIIFNLLLFFFHWLELSKVNSGILLIILLPTAHLQNTFQSQFYRQACAYLLTFEIMDQTMSVVEERRQSKCAKLYREILQPRNISFGSTECLKTAANLNLKHKGNNKTDSCYVFDEM